jgi:hypothetical protein
MKLQTCTGISSSVSTRKHLPIFRKRRGKTELARLTQYTYHGEIAALFITKTVVTEGTFIDCKSKSKSRIADGSNKRE